MVRSKQLCTCLGLVAMLGMGSWAHLDPKCAVSQTHRERCHVRVHLAIQLPLVQAPRTSTRHTCPVCSTPDLSQDYGFTRSDTTEAEAAKC